MLLYFPGLVDVFRQCRSCGEYKPIGLYKGGKRGYLYRTCSRCRYQRVPMPHTGSRSPTRSVALTDKGRAELREMRGAA